MEEIEFQILPSGDVWEVDKDMDLHPEEERKMPNVTIWFGENGLRILFDENE